MKGASHFLRVAESLATLLTDLADQGPDSPTSPHGLLDKAGAAEYLACSQDTITTLMQTEDLPHVRLGARLVRFDPEALRSWWQARQRRGGS